MVAVAGQASGRPTKTTDGPDVETRLAPATAIQDGVVRVRRVGTPQVRPVTVDAVAPRHVARPAKNGLPGREIAMGPIRRPADAIDGPDVAAMGVAEGLVLEMERPEVVVGLPGARLDLAGPAPTHEDQGHVVLGSAVHVHAVAAVAPTTTPPATVANAVVLGVDVGPEDVQARPSDGRPTFQAAA